MKDRCKNSFDSNVTRRNSSGSIAHPAEKINKNTVGTKYKSSRQAGKNSNFAEKGVHRKSVGSSSQSLRSQMQRKQILRDGRSYGTKNKNTTRLIFHVLIIVGITIGSIIAALLIALFVLFRGPSETARVEWVNMFNETSQMKWLPGLFLPKEQVDEIINSSQIIMVDEGTVSDLDAIDTTNTTDEIEIIDVKGESFQGKMMIIHDPSKVFLGTIPEFYEGAGQTVQDMINNYSNVIGGINAGDFIDNGANNSFTAMPLGLVISNGEILMCESGDYDTPYHITGLTYDNKLVLGNISANEAIEMGIRDAVYTNEITTGPFLIMNGQPMIEEVPDTSVYGGGVNPRTVIGQRKDGAIIFIVIDGRQANSLGATFVDLIYLLQDYDVYNACAMDGGTSSQMVYQGEILNHPYSGKPRKCPTAWMIRQ